MRAAAFVSRGLTIDGTPGGADSIIGNYTLGAPGVFFYTVPANSKFYMARALIFIRDNGKMNWTQYGTGVALTNGLIIRAKDPSGAVVLQSAPFKSNNDWARVSFDAKILSDGAGDDILVCAWSFASAGSPIVFEAGSRIEAVAQDNMTTLIDHRVAVNGELK